MMEVKLNNLPIPVFLVSEDGSIKAANREACVISGILCDDIVGVKWEELWIDGGRAKEFLSKVFETGKTASLIARLRNGVEVLAKAVNSNGDAVVVFITECGFFRDRCRIFNLIGDYVCILDSNYTIIDCNRQFAELVGMSVEEVIGRKCYELMHGTTYPPDDCPVVLSIERMKRKREEKAVEKIVDGVGGRKYRVIVYPIYRDNRLAEILHIARDITEEVKREEHKQRMSRLEALGTMVAGVAHDFNNILTPIIGYAEMGTERATDPDIKNYFEMIYKQGIRAASLIKQLLDFARKSEYEMRPLDLLSLFKEFTKLIRRILPENIELKVDYDRDLWKVKADPLQIQQIMFNLVSNAKDAMPNGGVLKIELKNCVIDSKNSILIKHPFIKAGEYVKIVVEDTGIGMTDEVKERVFEPFFTTKEPGRGTGLGLSQVYGIVKQLGGYILIDSKLGEGTKITILIPRIEADEEVKMDFYEPDLPDIEAVLVVEDSADVRKAIADSLRRYGCDVYEASCSYDAMKILKEHPEIEVVIADIVMPGESGIDMSNKMINIKDDLIFVFITGYPIGNEIKDIKAKYFKILFKPTTAKDIIDAISTLYTARFGNP